jgi:hypothetical protein
MPWVDELLLEVRAAEIATDNEASKFPEGSTDELFDFDSLEFSNKRFIAHEPAILQVKVLLENTKFSLFQNNSDLFHSLGEKLWLQISIVSTVQRSEDLTNRQPILLLNP